MINNKIRLNSDWNFIRRDRLMSSLDFLQSAEEREKFLIDKLFMLQDSLAEVEISYCQLLLSYNRLCALDL